MASRTARHRAVLIFYLKCAVPAGRKPPRSDSSTNRAGTVPSCFRMPTGWSSEADAEDRRQVRRGSFSIPPSSRGTSFAARSGAKQKEILRAVRNLSAGRRQGMPRLAARPSRPPACRSGGWCATRRARSSPLRRRCARSRHSGRTSPWPAQEARSRQLLPEPTSTGLDLGPSRYAFGASSSAGINIQGLHGSNVLIVADEAPGIESDIWDAIEGIRAGGNVHVLELGNPVIPSGHFYDSFTRNRSIYNCISISAFDTPNLQHLDGRPVTEEELLAMSPRNWPIVPFRRSSRASGCGSGSKCGGRSIRSTSPACWASFRPTTRPACFHCHGSSVRGAIRRETEIAAAQGPF